MRKIFIWKGAKSPEETRYISSRSAKSLQESLVKDSNLPKCELIFVDEGEEPSEFLSLFLYHVILHLGDLKKVYTWKGLKTSVREKFIRAKQISEITRIQEKRDKKK